MCFDNKLAQKEFRRKGGIEILKKNLVYQNVIDQIGNQKIFIMIVLDCLWNSIIGNKRNEEQFIDMDGMFTIFELLEQSDNIHIKLILSCLASLVDNKRSYSYFLQWKSNSNSNIDATKLLINIYRSEDSKYGVRYENGILQAVDRPINPKTSKICKENNSTVNKENRKGSIYNKNTNTSIFKINNLNDTKSSIQNMDDNNIKDNSIYKSENFVESYLNQRIIEITKEFDLRETIFSIFYRIGFNQLSNVSLPEDKQTLIMIKNYPIFKNLENWLDVLDELRQMNIKPISDDENYIMTQIEESKERLYSSIKQQEHIYEMIKKSQSDDLKDYFKKIQDFSKLQLENKKLKDKENIN